MSAKDDYLRSRHGSYDRLVSEEANRQIRRLLGTSAGQEASARVGLAFQSAAAVNPKLYECSPASVAAAVALSAIYRLMPGGPTPEVYLIPRGGRVEWNVSYHGLLKLVNRAGTRISAHLVFEGDTFVYQEGTEPLIQHRPAPLEYDDYVEDIEHLRGGYVVARYPDGSTRFIVIRKARILASRAESDSWKRGKKGPWAKWPLEMALKTLIRTAIRRGIAPLSGDAAAAYGARTPEASTAQPATPATPAPRALPGPAAPLGGLSSAIPAPRLTEADAGFSEEDRASSERYHHEISGDKADNKQSNEPPAKGRTDTKNPGDEDIPF